MELLEEMRKIQTTIQDEEEEVEEVQKRLHYFVVNKQKDVNLMQPLFY